MGHQAPCTPAAALEVVTIGEAMVQFMAAEIGPLRSVTRFVKRLGGAEANVAVGLARLGHSVGWVSRLGQDEFGMYVASVLRAEGVDISRVRYDPEAPTGVYFKELRAIGASRVVYYRSGSAASRMSTSDLDPDYVFQGKYVHVSGITPALSPSCAQMTRWLIAEANRRGVRVSFDVNFRPALWKGRDPWRELRELIMQSYIVFLGAREAEYLFGTSDQDALAERADAAGIPILILKLDAEGTVAFANRTQIRMPAPRVLVVDPVGAGDAFAAGVLSALLRGQDLSEALALGTTVASYVLSVPGDIEGLPTRQEAERLIGQV